MWLQYNKNKSIVNQTLSHTLFDFEFPKNKKGAIGTLLRNFKRSLRYSYEPDLMDIEIPILEEAQLVVMVGCLRYSSLQTLSANAPNRAA